MWQIKGKILEPFILIYYLLQQIFINREKGFLIREEVYGELTNYKK